MRDKTQVMIIGAGAAGLFCAAQAAKSGLDVTVIDNGKKAGRKILMSGGGRCNFTNLYLDHQAYISSNRHFCKSALARYSQWDFLALIQKYHIAYHERDHGQLFCDNSAQDIVDMLLAECQANQVKIRLRSELLSLQKQNQHYLAQLSNGELLAENVVVASGGLSLPGLGGTAIGYRIAEQFAIPVVAIRAGLVPFTLHKPLLDILQPLSGIAIPATVTAENGVSFRENLLFTHRGLSGPVILQISNYWLAGEFITINLLPDIDVVEFIDSERQTHPNQQVKSCLAKLLPKRLIDALQQLAPIPDLAIGQLSNHNIKSLADRLHRWRIQPNGTEGYRTAEVTLGGVDTNYLSSKTMEAINSPGLYFIGEVVDVTGWLGGYNFQWAWSSAWACAQSLASKEQCWTIMHFSK